MFNGYLEFSGTELINQQRTEAYVDHLAPALALKRRGGESTLHLVTGDSEYRSPMLDQAPWVNEFDPTTDQFYGVYPIDIQGIGSSTYAAGTTESVGNGGTTQDGRYATRDVKVSALVVAGTELAAETGLTWLRAAVAGGECDDQCGGGSLRFFLTEPKICPIEWGPETSTPGERSFGTLAAGRRIAYRWTSREVDPTMPARVTWTSGAQEGVEVEYGALAYDGSTLFSRRVHPLRLNYATNPTFRTSAAGWLGSPRTWISGSGVDDGGCLQVTALPQGTGIYGAGTYGIGPYGAADPNSSTVVADVGQSEDGPIDPALVVDPPVAASVTSSDWLTPDGAVTVSAAFRGDTGAQVTLELLDLGTGDTVATTQIVVGDPWTRVSVTGNTAGGSALRLTSDGTFFMDQVLAEWSAEEFDYFDGSVDDIDGFTADWLGVPDASPSRLQVDGGLTITADASDFVPYFMVTAGSATNLQLRWQYREPIGVEAQLAPIERTLHKVAVTQAPQIVQRIDATANGGGYFIQVEFLFNAGNPFVYGPPVDVDVSGAVTAAYHDPTVIPELDDDWLYDPTAIVPTPPPAAPQILADAVDPSITSWQRYYVQIPAREVADWASSVPLLTINTLASAVRPIRVRFHPNPFGYPVTSVDPLSYCADFLVSYLPAHSSLLVNGISQSATASKAGVATVPADSILYGSDGGPMSWPHLSCGIDYVMTIDVPTTSDYALFDVQLQLLREE